MEQKIKDIQLIPVRPKDGLVGFASFVFDESFYLANIAIYTRPLGGFRLVYPVRKVGEQSLPIFHPINKKISDLIEQEIITKFEELQSV